jgi:hypothetical protein
MMNDIQKMLTKIDLNSNYGHLLPKKLVFEKVDENLIDGELYHTVVVTKYSEVWSWLILHDAIDLSASWAVNCTFDVPDKLYMMMLLRWK